MKRASDEAIQEAAGEAAAILCAVIPGTDGWAHLSRVSALLDELAGHDMVLARGISESLSAICNERMAQALRAQWNEPDKDKKP